DVSRADQTLMIGEDRHGIKREIVFVLAAALASPVDVVRTIELLQQVGPPALNLVLHGGDADEPGQATGPRCLEAHQHDHVTLVVVKNELRGCLVSPNVGLVDVQPEVADMAKEMAVRVLRERDAEMLPDPPKDDFALRFVEAVCGKTAHKEEAA